MSGKQLTITGESRKRLDQIYAHELEVGDVFCKNMRDYRARNAYTVYENTFIENQISGWKGYLKYTDRRFSEKFGKDISSERIIRDPKMTVIFLKKSNG